MRPADVRRAAGAFPDIGVVRSVEPLEGGHIHRTFRVVGAGGAFVVQRCNRTVIPDLAGAMANVEVVAAVSAMVVAPARTTGGGTWWRGPDGAAWRATPFLEGTQPGAPVRTAARAGSLGAGLGRFHRSLAGLDPARLVVTLPGFHDPAGRVDALRRAAATDAAGRAAGAGPELEALLAAAPALVATASGWRPPAIPTRVVHLDAKADNFLVDAESGAVRALVDLDTVMPGSLLWDVGDLIRSATGPEREDETDPAAVVFDLARYRALADGYLAATDGLLTAEERRALGRAGPVVTFEQAVRFLTDHLDGDRYYRVGHAGHNLERCRCQLGLLHSMEAQRSAMIWPS